MNGIKILKLVGASLAVGVFGTLVWLENRRPLRRSVESKLVRSGRNLAVAGVSAIAVQLIETPIVESLAKFVERKKWGILKLVPLPRWLENILAIVLMDYTLYLWHVLSHRVQFLWRFHAVHHADLDLDASTAIRFHFGELILSVPWRAAQIVVIGVSPASLAAWQSFLFVSVLFHHSNLRLPADLEKRLGRLIVTPRMHGIHHSIVEDETNSNWSSGLAVWDGLHGTLRSDVVQDDITIGIPGFQKPDDLTVSKILTMPFGK